MVSRSVLIKAPILRELHQQTVIRGGGQGKLTICLTAAVPAGGVTVNLKTNRLSTLESPGDILVPAGKGRLSINLDATAVNADIAVVVTEGFKGAAISRDIIVRDLDAEPEPTMTSAETFSETATATSTETPTRLSCPVI